MVSLSTCEIIDELKKLGIDTLIDQVNFLRDYSDYYSFINLEKETVF